MAPPYASLPMPLTNTVCVRRPDKYNKFLTVQHSAVCSWEDYSSWEMKHPNKKEKTKMKPTSAASAAGPDWRPPFQPTTLKELNVNGDMVRMV